MCYINGACNALRIAPLVSALGSLDTTQEQLDTCSLERESGTRATARETNTAKCLPSLVHDDDA